MKEKNVMFLLVSIPFCDIFLQINYILQYFFLPLQPFGKTKFL